MKITINKGENIEDAINLLSKFILQNYSNYPILKNTLNIYMTLKNENEEVCPDNEKEYMLNNNCIIDILKERKKQALDELFNYWLRFRNSFSIKIAEFENLIKLDENYINTAIEKNKKKENIEKRKKIYEKNKDELELLIKNKNFIENLHLKILEDDVKIQFIKENSKNSIYSYNLYVLIIFEDIENENYYFDNKGLHKGLPY